MPKHPKFRYEKVCDGCGCSFLPEKGYEKVQKQCLGCAKLPELPKEPVGIGEVVEKLPETSKQEKVKNCKKCGKEFTPLASANTICENCK